MTSVAIMKIAPLRGQLINAHRRCADAHILRNELRLAYSANGSSAFTTPAGTRMKYHHPHWGEAMSQRHGQQKYRQADVQEHRRQTRYEQMITQVRGADAQREHLTALRTDIACQAAQVISAQGAGRIVDAHELGRQLAVTRLRFDPQQRTIITRNILRCSSRQQTWFRLGVYHFMFAVNSGQSSVRNGEAGRPSLLKKPGMGASSQAKRTAAGFLTPFAWTTTV